MSVQSLTVRHHLLAKRLARGLSAAEAILGTTYTIDGVRHLQADAVFQLLISKYKEPIGDANSLPST